MTEFTNKRLIESLKELNEAVESGKLSSYGIVVPGSLKEALERGKLSSYGIMLPGVLSEELELRAETAKWAKIGRKPNEFKKGDIVSDNTNTANFTVISDSEIGEGMVNFRSSYVPISDIGLVTPVEARFDLDGE